MKYITLITMALLLTTCSCTPKPVTMPSAVEPAAAMRWCFTLLGKPLLNDSVVSAHCFSLRKHCNLFQDLATTRGSMAGVRAVGACTFMVHP
jgi:hypothetical protein